MKTWSLYVLVFLAGAAVLAVEILGTRILGPFYGVSLFLWSALITTTLVALSAGYTVGGRWADRGATLPRLCYIISGAGAWLLLVPWIKEPVLYLAEPFGLRFAVLAAALILFAPPLTLLGMVSPYAIRLRAVHLDEVGRTAGDLYALSTIGGVIAALLTGFFLIPNVGVIRLTMMVGGILLISAFLGLVVSRSVKAKAAAVVVVLFAGLLFFLKLPAGEGADPERGVVAVEQSAYGEIRVVDLYDRRHLLIDGGMHTILERDTGEASDAYVAALELSRDFFETPGDLLLIGLGGGALVKNFSYAGWTVQTVEIDPVVTRMARRYFGLKEEDGAVVQADGRQFLATRAATYDLIIMDAFGSSSIPFHLITEEAFGLIADHLKPGGVFAINIGALAWQSRRVRAITAALEQHFDTVMALPCFPEADPLGNMILYASQRGLGRPPEPAWTEAPPEEEWPMDYARHFAWVNRFVPDTRNVPPLTDDLNPSDVWGEAVNRVDRGFLHDYFDERNVSW